MSYKSKINYKLKMKILYNKLINYKIKVKIQNMSIKTCKNNINTFKMKNII